MFRPSSRFSVYCLALISLSLGAVPVSAGFNPTYSQTFQDSVTGNQSFTVGSSHYWNIESGADSYQNDFYERPTAQTYQAVGGKYAAKEYFGYIDIVQAKYGFDQNYLYVAIKLFSLNKYTQDGNSSVEGLKERYGFRLGLDADGNNSVLLYADQPQFKNSPNTQFGKVGTFGYRDVNGDVGGDGRSITKTDDLSEVQGNGYERNIISDGKMNGNSVLWTRIDPLSNITVEFVLDYKALGFTFDQLTSLGYLEFEAIKGGPKDPQNYMWNDEYTKNQAGSPYQGVGNLSEFGTQGLGNIYELDTLHGGGGGGNLNTVPVPAGLILLASAVPVLALRRLIRCKLVAA